MQDWKDDEDRLSTGLYGASYTDVLIPVLHHDQGSVASGVGISANCAGLNLGTAADVALGAHMHTAEQNKLNRFSTCTKQSKVGCDSKCNGNVFSNTNKLELM